MPLSLMLAFIFASSQPRPSLISSGAAFDLFLTDFNSSTNSDSFVTANRIRDLLALCFWMLSSICVRCNTANLTDVLFDMSIKLYAIHLEYLLKSDYKYARRFRQLISSNQTLLK